MKAIVLAVLLVGCSNAVADDGEAWRSQPLPLECQVDTMAACFVPAGVPAGDEDCLLCPQPDGTAWLFLDQNGSEHFQADFSTRICRIYGNGAWTVGPTADNIAHGPGAPYDFSAPTAHAAQ